MLRVRVHIMPCPNKKMTGRDLRRLRTAANISEDKVGKAIGTNRIQIQRLQKKQWFELHPVVMQQLLSILKMKLVSVEKDGQMIYESC